MAFKQITNAFQNAEESAAYAVNSPAFKKALKIGLISLSVFQLVSMTACAANAIEQATGIPTLDLTPSLTPTPTDIPTVTPTHTPIPTEVVLPTLVPPTPITNPIIPDSILASADWGISPVIIPGHDFHAVVNPLIDHLQIDEKVIIDGLNANGLQAPDNIQPIVQGAGEALLGDMANRCPVQLDMIANAMDLNGGAGNVPNLHQVPVHMNVVGQPNGFEFINADGAVVGQPFEAAAALKVDPRIVNVNIVIPNIAEKVLNSFQFYIGELNSFAHRIVNPRTPTLEFDCAGQQQEVIIGNNQPGMNFLALLRERLYGPIINAGGNGAGDIGNPDDGIPIPPDPIPVPPDGIPIPPDGVPVP